MTKKMYNLVVGIIGGVETIAVALVTYLAPANATPINASILIVGTAIQEVCAQFKKE